VTRPASDRIVDPSHESRRREAEARHTIDESEGGFGPEGSGLENFVEMVLSPWSSRRRLMLAVETCLRFLAL
jgi:hypothetical protein